MKAILVGLGKLIGASLIPFVVLGGCWLIAMPRSSIGVPLLSFAIGSVGSAVLFVGRWVKSCPVAVRKVYSALQSPHPGIAITSIACLVFGGISGIAFFQYRTAECRAEVASIEHQPASPTQLARISSALGTCAKTGPGKQVEQLESRISEIWRAECTNRASRFRFFQPESLPAEVLLPKLAEAKTIVTEGIQLCDATKMAADSQTLRAKLSLLDQQIDLAQQVVHRAAQAEKENQAQAAQAEKERQAVASVDRIRSKLRSVLQTANQGDWYLAGAKLDEIDSMLTEFADTSVTSTPVWKSLSNEAGVLRARVQPQLDRVRAHDAPAQEARAFRQVQQQTVGNRIGDGSFRSKCEFLVKRQLLSPSSAHIPWLFDDTPIVETADGSKTWRSWVDAKNAFGVKIRHFFTCSYNSRTEAVNAVFDS